LMEAAEVRARTKQRQQPPPWPKPVHPSARIADSMWDVLDDLTLAPDATARISFLKKRLRDAQAEYKAMKDDTVEPGTAMEVEQIKLSRMVDAIAAELRETVSNALLEALGEPTDSGTLFRYFATSRSPSADKSN
jgi:hypothetical protein